MSTNPMFEVGAVALGYVGIVASWRRPTMDQHRVQPMVCIQTCSSSDDNVHTPAESVTISSRPALLALRAAIDEALKEGPSS